MRRLRHTHKLYMWPPVIAVVALAQRPAPIASERTDVMLAAVTRDMSLLTGGINSGSWTEPGTVVVEPLAMISPPGKWRSLPCVPGDGKGCLKFQRDYLRYRHAYTVISSQGKGATIRAEPATLSECWGYTSKGTYSGSNIEGSVIAASSDVIFADSPSLRALSKGESASTRKRLGSLVPKRLDSTQALRLFALRLENRDLIVIQRDFSDVAKPQNSGLKFIFAIGTMSGGRFHVGHWKENIEDEVERVLGTIRLKSGREFVVTVVNDPESQSFRVYGIRNGRVSLVFSGGGSSC